jgi:hypothetical protein
MHRPILMPPAILTPGGARHSKGSHNMAKSQKRSTREVRKPKATKAKIGAPANAITPFPVNTLMQKPKAKI